MSLRFAGPAEPTPVAALLTARLRRCVAAVVVAVLAALPPQWCAAAMSAFTVAPTTLRFDHLTREQGFTADFASCIGQDRYGFIWIGTEEGLFRYDGFRFVAYRHDPAVPGSLAAGTVYSLYFDSDGRFWIGTGGGLDRYDPATDRFVHVALPRAPDATAAPEVYVVVPGGKSRLWLGTSQGLLLLDPGSGNVAAFRHDAAKPTSIALNVVHALAADASGRVWVGTDGGVDMLPRDGEDFRHFSVVTADHPDPRANVVNALLVDADDNLWVGSDIRVERWNIGGSEPMRDVFGPAQGLPADFVDVLMLDARRNVWIGTRFNGLARWSSDLGRFERFVHSSSDTSSLRAGNVTALFADRLGTLWIGESNGIDRADMGTGTLTRYAANTEAIRPGLAHRVNNLAQDRRGRLWLSGPGLLSVDPKSGRWTGYYKDAQGNGSLGIDDVHVAYADAQDRIWAGTHIGIDLVDPATGSTRHFVTGDRLADSIEALFVDPAGVLWAGSDGGLHRWNVATGQFKLFHPDHDGATGAGTDNIRQIAVDKARNLWLGTMGGLVRFDPVTERFEYFRHDPARPSSLSHDRVYALLVDRSGTLWAGTERGLNRMMRNADGEVTFRTYSTRDGLPGNTILNVVQDRAGYFWVATKQGVARLDAASGAVVAFPGQSALRDANVMALGDDGSIFVVGAEGLVNFDPATLHGNPHPPQVALTDIAVFNKSIRRGGVPAGARLDAPIEAAQSLTLGPAQSVFTLEFAALHFSDPARNRYAYMLEGVDPDWVNTDASRRFATYTNLDPGRYIFRVKAASRDGVWNEDGIRLTIDIEPPFWKTWWFQCLLAVLVLASAYAAYLVRVRALLAQRSQLEHVVAERTSDLTRERGVTRDLLYNILPRDVADELVATGSVRPARYEHASVLFADFRGFTEVVATVPADRLVAELNEIFASFDDIVGDCGIEKIKTIGDAYMAVGGLPTPCADHAQRCVAAALRMVEFLDQRNEQAPFKWNVRIGIHSGPVVAGIVGKRKYVYDVWGDAVNTAARLEAASEPGRVNVSAYTYDLIRACYVGEYRGKVEAKGKGALDMYFVVGPVANLPADPAALA